MYADNCHRPVFWGFLFFSNRWLAPLRLPDSEKEVHESKVIIRTPGSLQKNLNLVLETRQTDTLLAVCRRYKA